MPASRYITVEFTVLNSLFWCVKVFGKLTPRDATVGPRLISHVPSSLLFLPSFPMSRTLVRPHPMPLTALYARFARHNPSGCLRDRSTAMWTRVSSAAPDKYRFPLFPENNRLLEEAFVPNSSSSLESDYGDNGWVLLDPYSPSLLLHHCMHSPYDHWARLLYSICFSRQRLEGAPDTAVLSY